MNVEPRYERYLSLLMETNAHTNLTAIRTPEAVRIRHFEDSLALLSAADFADTSVLDVGSGAGFPGLVLKLAVPSIRLSLLEANEKKLSFLRLVCDDLDLRDVQFLQGRAEELAHESSLRESFDIVTARAVAAMEGLCELCLPFVNIGGLFLAMKEQEEGCTKLSVLGGEAISPFAYTLSDERRRLVLRIRKSAAAQKAYPRSWARIKRDMERLHTV